MPTYQPTCFSVKNRKPTIILSWPYHKKRIGLKISLHYFTRAGWLHLDFPQEQKNPGVVTYQISKFNDILTTQIQSSLIKSWIVVPQGVASSYKQYTLSGVLEPDVISMHILMCMLVYTIVHFFVNFNFQSKTFMLVMDAYCITAEISAFG